MTDVDPRDFMDFYRLRVSISVLAETSMTRDDFDEDDYDFIYSTEEVEDELYVDFTSEQAAKKLIEEWNYSLDAIRRGALSIRRYTNSDSDADGLLMFHPSKR